MKHLLHILLLFVLLLAVVGGGCRRSPGEAERRLIAIDSLISAHPDSALTLLAEVDTATLGEPDRAYHALLTVQAMYKAYIPATDSTLICRAQRYYVNHGPVDRQIRTMRYRASVAEDLGDPELAMRWYKRTELTAREHHDDYNAGYALMSMGVLYQSHYSTEPAHEKYKQSLPLLSHTNLACYKFVLSMLAQTYAENDIDSSTLYLNELRLANQKFSDASYDLIIDELSIMIPYSRNHFQATVDTLSHIPLHRRTFRAWHYGCVSYCKLGDLDSAQACFNQAPAPSSRVDSMLYFHSLAEILRLRKDYQGADKYELKSSNISGEELLDDTDMRLQSAENAIVEDLHEHKQHRFHVSLVASAIALFGVLLVMAILLHRRRQRSLRHENDTLRQNLEQLSKVRDKLLDDAVKLDDSLQSKKAIIKQQELELSESRKTLQQTESELHTLEFQFNETISRLNKRETEKNSVLEQELHLLDIEKQRLTEKCRTLQSKVEEARSSNEQMTKRFIDRISQLNCMLSEAKHRNEQLSEKVDALKELNDRFTGESQPAKERHTFEAWKPLLSAIRRKGNELSIDKQLTNLIKTTLSDSYFKQLRNLVDIIYSGLVSKLVATQNLSNRDINIICLHLCGLPNSVIAIYTNTKTHSIPKIKASIAKKYFGDMMHTLDDFRGI